MFCSDVLTDLEHPVYDAVVSKMYELSVLRHPCFTSIIGEKTVRGTTAEHCCIPQYIFSKIQPLFLYFSQQRPTTHIVYSVLSRIAWAGLFKPSSYCIYALIATEFKPMWNQLIGCFHLILINKYFLPSFSARWWNMNSRWQCVQIAKAARYRVMPHVKHQAVFGIAGGVFLFFLSHSLF